MNEPCLDTVPPDDDPMRRRVHTAMHIWFWTSATCGLLSCFGMGPVCAMILFAIPIFTAVYRLEPRINQGDWKAVMITSVIMSVVGALLLFLPVLIIGMIAVSYPASSGDRLVFLTLLLGCTAGLTGGLQLLASWLALSSKRDYLAWAERKRIESARKGGDGS